MAHSLEIRVPVLDMPLFEQFVEIPTLDPTIEKRTIARKVAPMLPEEVLSRPKTGFSVPIYQWLNPNEANTIINHREWAKMLYKIFTAG
jgi:asparagine synthase (glutamine-hydrolysing)